MQQVELDGKNVAEVEITGLWRRRKGDHVEGIKNDCLGRHNPSNVLGFKLGERIAAEVVTL